MEQALQHMSYALQNAAVAAALHIHTFTKGKKEEILLPSDIKKQRVKKIDIAADNAFRKTLNASPVEFHGIDAEGGKEAHPDKLGEAMPLSIGMFGKGKEKATFVLDVVEGTTAAAHNHPNAISIAGMSGYNSVLKVPINPKTSQTHLYFRKLFAPAAFKKILSLEKTPEENLKDIIKAGKIKPHRITVAVMNRQANESIIKAAKKLDTKLQLIEAGDLLWGLKALLSDPEKPIIMIGRGGAEEGAITQIAAHALKATGQLQAMTEEKNIESHDTTPIWLPSDYVRSNYKKSVVVFSSITKNTLFNIPEVSIKNKVAHIHEVIINHTGTRKNLSKILI